MKIAIAAVVVALLAALIAFLWWQSQPSRLDAFAQCLEENGAIFYGTFWCPYCQRQKASFGRSAKYLPYVECSTADGRGQLAVCQEKNIDSYPTWEFNDGSRETGEVPLERLAEKTNCQLPV